jgi:hypothetical protein
MSDAEMEDTGGLLSLMDAGQQVPQVRAGSGLADQIRTLYGNRGDWNQGGIDRAAELADLLLKQGVTDVSTIGFKDSTIQNVVPTYEGTGDAAYQSGSSTVDVPVRQAVLGDRTIGFAGDYNNDNTFGNNSGDYLKDGLLGWSARGDGNVSYQIGTDEQGNNYLKPQWGSSSDMGDVRDIAKLAATMAAAVYGIPMLGEAAAAAGAGEAAAAGAGSLTSGITPAAVAAAEAALPTALSSAPLSTTLAAPLAELTSGGLLTGTGAPAAIVAPMGGLIAPEVMAAVAPELAAVAPEVAGPGLQTITTTGKLGSAAPSLLSTAAPAAAAATLAASTMATDPANYSNEGVNPTDRANMGPDAKSVPTVDVSTTPLDSLKAWATANPQMARMLFSGAGALLSATGGSGSSGGGGYVDSGYRPTISRGGFDPSPQARQMAPQPTGLLTTPTTGQPNSGLWRYSGLLGG